MVRIDYSSPMLNIACHRPTEKWYALVSCPVYMPSGALVLGGATITKVEGPISEERARDLMVVQPKDVQATGDLAWAHQEQQQQNWRYLSPAEMLGVSKLYNR